jgi:hypothetical protein
MDLLNIKFKFFFPLIGQSRLLKFQCCELASLHWLNQIYENIARFTNWHTKNAYEKGINEEKRSIDVSLLQKPGGIRCLEWLISPCKSLMNTLTSRGPEQALEGQRRELQKGDERIPKHWSYTVCRLSNRETILSNHQEVLKAYDKFKYAASIKINAISLMLGAK